MDAEIGRATKRDGPPRQEHRRLRALPVDHSGGVGTDLDLFAKRKNRDLTPKRKYHSNGASRFFETGGAGNQENPPAPPPPSAQSLQLPTQPPCPIPRPPPHA